MSLKGVLVGELKSWRGLETTETVETLSPQLSPIDRTSPPETRTRHRRRFACTLFRRPVAPRCVEVWVPAGTEHVALVEYDDPPVLDLKETLDGYGAPDLILDDQRFAAGAIVRELIYAQRGITISVAEPFESTGKAKRSAVHLQLFPATTLAGYLSDIGVSAHARPKVNR